MVLDSPKLVQKRRERRPRGCGRNERPLLTNGWTNRKGDLWRKFQGERRLRREYQVKTRYSVNDKGENWLLAFVAAAGWWLSRQPTTAGGDPYGSRQRGAGILPRIGLKALTARLQPKLFLVAQLLPGLRGFLERLVQGRDVGRALDAFAVH